MKKLTPEKRTEYAEDKLSVFTLAYDQGADLFTPVSIEDGYTFFETSDGFMLEGFDATYSMIYQVRPDMLVDVLMVYSSSASGVLILGKDPVYLADLKDVVNVSFLHNEQRLLDIRTQLKI